MLRAALASLVLTLPLAARANESWIEPLRWRIARGESLEADIMAGRNFEGRPAPVPPGFYLRFQVLTPDGTKQVEGRTGDEPELSIGTGAAGLYDVVHVSDDLVVKHDDFDAFRAFLLRKGLGDVLDRHADRGLPETGFSETVTRYDKALVAVGGGAGRDRVLGLTTELTAFTNPYTSQADSVAVLATWAKIPRPDARIEVFERGPAGAVRSFTARTDTDGMALVPVRPGHAYLLSSVVMLAHLPETPGAPVWHSCRASLTFEVPG